MSSNPSIPMHNAPDEAWPPVLPEPELAKGDTNLNPDGMGLLALLREDLRTHEGDWMDQGFWALAVNRLGNWRMSIRFKLLRAPVTILYRVLRRVVQWTCGIKLDYTVQVGRRVHLWHFGGMILGAKSIGDDCHIRQNTTFGVRYRNTLGKPIIQDRVEIGCGVVILGHVVIGHDSVIGANSVVLDHIPPYSLAVGSPAKVVRNLRPKPEDSASEPAAESASESA